MATIIDCVIILLLIGSITYGYMVSRKVRLLMATLRELEPLVEEFSSAVEKSHDSVSQMRENIEIVEQVRQPSPVIEPPMEEATSFATRRTGSGISDVPSLRIIRDKKELVQAFFDNSNPVKA
jgi:hypothetical protein